MIVMDDTDRSRPVKKSDGDSASTQADKKDASLHTVERTENVVPAVGTIAAETSSQAGWQAKNAEKTKSVVQVEVSTNATGPKVVVGESQGRLAAAEDGTLKTSSTLLAAAAEVFASGKNVKEKTVKARVIHDELSTTKGSKKSTKDKTVAESSIVYPIQHNSCPEVHPKLYCTRDGCHGVLTLIGDQNKYFDLGNARRRALQMAMFYPQTYFHGTMASCSECGDRPMMKGKTKRAKQWQRFCTVCERVFSISSFFKVHGKRTPGGGVKTPEEPSSYHRRILAGMLQRDVSTLLPRPTVVEGNNQETADMSHHRIFEALTPREIEKTSELPPHSKRFEQHRVREVFRHKDGMLYYMDAPKLEHAAPPTRIAAPPSVMTGRNSSEQTTHASAAIETARLRDPAHAAGLLKNRHYRPPQDQKAGANLNHMRRGPPQILPGHRMLVPRMYAPQPPRKILNQPIPPHLMSHMRPGIPNGFPAFAAMPPNYLPYRPTGGMWNMGNVIVNPYGHQARSSGIAPSMTTHLLSRPGMPPSSHENVSAVGGIVEKRPMERDAYAITDSKRMKLSDPRVVRAQGDQLDTSPMPHANARRAALRSSDLSEQAKCPPSHTMPIALPLVSAITPVSKDVVNAEYPEEIRASAEEQL